MEWACPVTRAMLLRHLPLDVVLPIFETSAPLEPAPGLQLRALDGRRAPWFQRAARHEEEYDSAEEYEALLDGRYGALSGPALRERMRADGQERARRARQREEEAAEREAAVALSAALEPLRAAPRGGRRDRVQLLGARHGMLSALRGSRAKVVLVLGGRDALKVAQVAKTPGDVPMASGVADPRLVQLVLGLDEPAPRRRVMEWLTRAARLCDPGAPAAAEVLRAARTLGRKGAGRGQQDTGSGGSSRPQSFRCLMRSAWEATAVLEALRRVEGVLPEE